MKVYRERFDLGDHLESEETSYYIIDSSAKHASSKELAHYIRGPPLGRRASVHPVEVHGAQRTAGAQFHNALSRPQVSAHAPISAM